MFRELTSADKVLFRTDVPRKLVAGDGAGIRQRMFSMDMMVEYSQQSLRFHCCCVCCCFMLAFFTVQAQLMMMTMMVVMMMMTVMMITDHCKMEPE